MHEDHPFLVWGDALGVGAFAVIGCQNGLRKGACLMSGGRQGVGGGAGRAGHEKGTSDSAHSLPPRYIQIRKAEVDSGGGAL